MRHRRAHLMTCMAVDRVFPRNTVAKTVDLICRTSGLTDDGLGCVVAHASSVVQRVRTGVP